VIKFADVTKKPRPLIYPEEQDPATKHKKIELSCKGVHEEDMQIS
jgi:hypothetical protein